MLTVLSLCPNPKVRIPPQRTQEFHPRPATSLAGLTRLPLPRRGVGAGFRVSLVVAAAGQRGEVRLVNGWGLGWSGEFFLQSLFGVGLVMLLICDAFFWIRVRSSCLLSLGASSFSSSFSVQTTKFEHISSDAFNLKYREAQHE